MAKPSPEKWLWMRSAIWSGSSLSAIGPAGQEAPLLVDVFPLQAHRGDGGAVDVPEVCAVGTVLGDDLGVYRFASARLENSG